MSGAGITSNTIKPDSLTNDLWVNMPQFSDVKVLGTLLGNGNATLSTSASNTLTVNSTATFNQPPVMSGASITANTIPSSAIVGGVGGSSALSSSNQSARTSTQIGYQLSYSATTYVGQTSGFISLQSFTLSPQNSVWILNGNINSCTSASTQIDWLFYGFQTGGNYLPNGIGISAANSSILQIGSYNFGLGFPVCCVYTVPSSSQTISFNTGMKSTPYTAMFPFAWTVTATRIA